MTDVELRIDARWVLPIEPAGLLHQHSLLVREGRIVAIAPTALAGNGNAGTAAEGVAATAEAAAAEAAAVPTGAVVVAWGGGGAGSEAWAASTAAAS